MEDKSSSENYEKVEKIQEGDKSQSKKRSKPDSTTNQSESQRTTKKKERISTYC